MNLQIRKISNYWLFHWHVDPTKIITFRFSILNGPRYLTGQDRDTPSPSPASELNICCSFVKPALGIVETWIILIIHVKHYISIWCRLFHLFSIINFQCWIKEAILKKTCWNVTKELFFLQFELFNHKELETLTF